MAEYAFRMEEVRQYYKFRPDEVFRRVTVNSLLALLLEVAKLEIQEADEAAIDEQQKQFDALDDADSAIGIQLFILVGQERPHQSLRATRSCS